MANDEPTPAETTTCWRCGLAMLPGTALVNGLTWGDDFGGESRMKSPPRGATLSRSGLSIIVRCLKCPECGHSFIPDQPLVVGQPKSLAGSEDGGDAAGRCPHGVRYPHPCRECDYEITDGEVKLFQQNEELRGSLAERDAEIARLRSRLEQIAGYESDEQVAKALIRIARKATDAG